MNFEESKMMDRISDLLNKLKNTNSSNEKIKILSSYKEDHDIVNFIKICYDPEYMFGVRSESIKNHITEIDKGLSFIEIINSLKNRTLSGNEALGVLKSFILNNKRYEDIILKFFDKNLEIGMGITQINKALGNIIPVHNVALASILNEDLRKTIDLSSYFIQQKLDGVRVTCFISEDSIIFKSRNGKIYNTLSNLESEIKNLYEKSDYYPAEIVLDGEVCVLNDDNTENWNQVVSEIRRKDHIIENPHYILFDILYKEEFYEQSISDDYRIRYENLEKFVNGSEMIVPVFSKPYSEELFQELLDKYVESSIWEGFILRKNAPYKSKRSKDIYKYKLFQDAEYKVIGVEYGTKQILIDSVMQNMNVVSALNIIHKGNPVSVGSGLSDKQRIEFYKNPDLILNKWIIVKYKQETKNEEGKPSLMFPVLKFILEEKRDF